MSSALLVAALLTVAWNLALLIVARLTETGPFQPEPVRRSMHQSLRTMQAEVTRLDLQTAAQEHGGVGALSPPESSQAERPSHEVPVVAPYAETSVTVTVDGETAGRRCSLCLN